MAITGIAAIAAGTGAALPLLAYTDQSLLRPDLFRESKRLAFVYDAQTFEPVTVAYQQVERLRAAVAEFESVGGFALAGTSASETDSAAPPIAWCSMEAEAFRAVGTSPQIGRFYSAAEERAGVRVAVIGHDLWRRLYRSDPSVIGRSVDRDGVSYEIVGVMPWRFRFPEGSPDVWIPLASSLTARPDLQALRIVVRLRPEPLALRENARETRVAQVLGRHRVTLTAVDTVLFAAARRAMPLLLVGAVVALFLSAAVVFHLMSGDAIGSANEIRIRTALGASRPRALGVFVCQAVILAAGGTLAGVGLAWWLIEVINLRLLDASASGVTLNDSRTTAIVLAVFSMFVIANSLGPLLYSSSPLRHWNATSDGGRSTQRKTAWRRLLTSAQVACATTFAICSALTAFSVRNLSTAPTGLTTDRIVTFGVELPRAQRAERGAQAEIVSDFADRLIAGMRLTPGVSGAAVSTNLPIHANGMKVPFSAGVRREGCDSANVRGVSEDYFHLLGIPMRQGRPLAVGDRHVRPRRIVVSHALARACWPEGRAVGSTAWLGSDPLTVVGVVADVPIFGVRRPVVQELFVPMASVPLPFVHVVAAVSSGDRRSWESSLRPLVLSIDPGARLMRARTLADVMADGEAPLLIRAQLLKWATLAALAVAGLGVYATALLMARQRRRELAVRVALGARPGSLLLGTMLADVVWSLPGLCAGVVLAVWTASSLEAVMFRVDEWLGPIYGASLLTVALLIAIASLTGTSRIVRTDLYRALNQE